MIRIESGALEAIEADGILRPVRSDFAAVSAAGRRVEIGAGEVLMGRLQGMNELPVGAALLTPGGDLAPFLIHVVVEAPDEAVSPEGVRRAFLNGLRRATEWELEIVAVPPLGTGAGNLEIELVGQIMVSELRRHLSAVAFPREVILVVESEYEVEALEQILATEPRDARGNGA